MNKDVHAARSKNFSARCGVTLAAVTMMLGSEAALAEQARTACILLDGSTGGTSGTIRILPAGQTNCNALEGAFQLVQPTRPTEKTLGANINANGTIQQEDTYTTPQGTAANWLSSVVVNADGTIRVNFASGVFTAAPSIKCEVTPTTDTVPPPAAGVCAPANQGGCPTPDRWVAKTTDKSIDGITVNTKDAQYKARLCNYPSSDFRRLSCLEYGPSTEVPGVDYYIPGNTLTVLPTQGGKAERSSFSIVCTGF